MRELTQARLRGSRAGSGKLSGPQAATELRQGIGSWKNCGESWSRTVKGAAGTWVGETITISVIRACGPHSCHPREAGGRLLLSSLHTSHGRPDLQRAAGPGIPAAGESGNLILRLANLPPWKEMERAHLRICHIS